jgi:DNA-directed RNA polymerase subunit H (RpoH/RPB5)
MVNDSIITIRKRVNSQINNPINKELPKIEIVEIIIKNIENNTGKNENIIKIVINSPKNGCSLVKF